MNTLYEAPTITAYGSIEGQTGAYGGVGNGDYIFGPSGVILSLDPGSGAFCRSRSGKHLGTGQSCFYMDPEPDED